METATGITCVWKPCQVLQVFAKRAKGMSYVAMETAADVYGMSNTLSGC